jgi:hypothetical protein
MGVTKMANIQWFKARDCWRVVFNLKIADHRVRRAKYMKKKSEAVLLRRAVEHVESATRTGLATADEIIDWINRGWIKTEEAAQTASATTLCAAARPITLLKRISNR